MVKPASTRTNKAQLKTQPHVVLLRLKALLRQKLQDGTPYMVYAISRNEAVKAIKDEDIEPYIASYNLNARDTLNAYEAWRMLYFTMWNGRQVIQKAT